MPGFRAALLLFLSSYSPLWLIFAIQMWDAHLAIPIVLGAAGVGLPFLTDGFFKSLAGDGEHPLPVERVVSKDVDSMNYISAYLIPFLGVRLDDPKQLLGIIVFMAVLFVLYVKGRMFHVNPVLGWFGYHVFEVETTKGKILSLVTKQGVIEPKSTVTAVSLDDYISIDKGGMT